MKSASLAISTVIIKTNQEHVNGGGKRQELNSRMVGHKRFWPEPRDPNSLSFKERPINNHPQRKILIPHLLRCKNSADNRFKGYRYQTYEIKSFEDTESYPGGTYPSTWESQRFCHNCQRPRPSKWSRRLEMLKQPFDFRGTAQWRSKGWKFGSEIKEKKMTK